MKIILVSWGLVGTYIQKPQSADTCLGIGTQRRFEPGLGNRPCPMTMTQPSAVPLGKPGTAASYQLRCDAMRCDRAGPAYLAAIDNLRTAGGPVPPTVILALVAELLAHTTDTYGTRR